MVDESDKSHWSFNPQLPTVTGFLGALTFTALILIMQFPSEIQFSEILISITAIVSFLFIMATLGGAIDQRHHHLITDQFMGVVSVCYVLGIFGMFAILPLLLFSFSVIGTIVLIIIESITLIFYFRHSPKVSVNDD